VGRDEKMGGFVAGIPLSLSPSPPFFSCGLAPLPLPCLYLRRVEATSQNVCIINKLTNGAVRKFHRPLKRIGEWRVITSENADTIFDRFGVSKHTKTNITPVSNQNALVQISENDTCVHENILRTMISGKRKPRLMERISKVSRGSYKTVHKEDNEAYFWTIKALT